jgi:site-specific DNA-methyltransferase (adenine-specific)
MEFIEKNIALYLEDAYTGMAKLPDNSYDLAIVDPPYGASTKANWGYDSQKKINGFGGNWKLTSEAWDLLSQNEILEGTLRWLTELQRLVKPTGSIWIHSTYHNSGFVNVCCQLLGLEIINEVVWYKRNAFPNLAARRLTASHETILWVHTGKNERKYLFNYDDAKKVKFEGDNLKEADKQLPTVWDVPNNKTKNELLFGTHPTQKPLRISERLLLVSGLENGKLLVPFAGSGTEMLAGLKFKMHVTGFELEQTYFDLSKKRLEHFLQSQNQLSLL